MKSKNLARFFRGRRVRSAALFAAALLGSALPALGYEYDICRSRNIVWEGNSVTFEPSLASFPPGSPWNTAVEAMRTAWNTETPGGVYQIQYNWVAGGNNNNNNGHNAILIPQPADWQWSADVLAVALTRWSTCNLFQRSRLSEADILFSPSQPWDHQLNPQPPLPQGPFSSVLVGIHEHGHAFGLNHENDHLATMNAFYPNGGVFGNNDEILPHADDTLGNRAGYGTLGAPRDVAATAFRNTGVGTSAVITPPTPLPRNQVVSIPFTVENRGTVNEGWIDVSFYLSPDRNITTGDLFLGSIAMTLTSGQPMTPSVTVTIPGTIPVGLYFFGWVVDPANSIPESDEGNNAVGLAIPLNIQSNRAPTACFTLSPASGQTPLYVSFDASCTTDADGDPLTYSWDFGDGNSGSFGSQTGHAYYAPAGGGYTVTLTVQDPSGATSTVIDFVEVTCGENCW